MVRGFLRRAEVGINPFSPFPLGVTPVPETPKTYRNRENHEGEGPMDMYLVLSPYVKYDSPPIPQTDAAGN